MLIMKRVLLAVLFCLPLMACDTDDGAAEEVGESMDNAAEETREAVDDAADDMEDAAEDVGDEMDDDY